MLRLFHPVWFLFPRMKNVMSSVACLICVCSAVSCFEIAWIYEYHNLAWDIQCMLNVGTYVIIIPVYLSRCWGITKKDLPDKQRKKKKNNNLSSGRESYDHPTVFKVNCTPILDYIHWNWVQTAVPGLFSSYVNPRSMRISIRVRRIPNGCKHHNQIQLISFFKKENICFYAPTCWTHSCLLMCMTF